MIRRRSKFTEYKYLEEEIVKQLDFSSYFNELEEIDTVEVRVFSKEKRDYTEDAIGEDAPTVDGFMVSFFLSSDLPIGSYVVQVIAKSAVQTRVIAFNLIVDEVFAS